MRVRRSVVGLRLAAALGDRLGEIGEQHGEPEPDDDLERRSRAARAPVSEVAHEAARWSAPRRPRPRTSPGCAPASRGSSLREGVAPTARARGCVAVEARLRLAALRHGRVPGIVEVGHGRALRRTSAGEHREVLDDRAERERPGRRSGRRRSGSRRPAARRTARYRSGRCRREAGTVFFAASEPAIARTGTIIEEAAEQHATPSVMLYQGVLPARPAKARAVVAGAEV